MIFATLYVCFFGEATNTITLDVGLSIYIRTFQKLLRTSIDASTQKHIPI